MRRFAQAIISIKKFYVFRSSFNTLAIVFGHWHSSEKYSHKFDFSQFSSDGLTNKAD